MQGDGGVIFVVRDRQSSSAKRKADRPNEAHVVAVLSFPSKRFQ